MNFLKQNILIIEDDLETLEIMIEIFESIFSNVYSAVNGYEAINFFQNYRIDVILCDINIPKLNGLAVIDKIREMNYSVPIIIISAYSDKETLLKALNSSIQGYIIKPITTDKVKNILEKIYYHQNHEFINNKIKLNDSISLELLNSQIIINNEIIKLTNKEKIFLKLLFDKKGSVVTYESIEQIVWDDEDRIMTGMSLRTLVKNIRKKLSYNLLRNVPKVGYRLMIQDCE